VSLHVFYPQYVDLMSALDSPIGHAVRADGGLKDASEMEWTYDKEESVPFPSDSLTIPATDDPAASPPSKSVRIHSFFTHAKPPATLVAGSRHSARTSRPSQRVRDANEVPSLATGSTTAKPSTGTKRKAAVNLSPGPTRRVVNKAVVELDDDNDGNDTEPDGYKTEPAEDEDPNDADISSQSLQAMADADHKVRSLRSLVESFTDILPSRCSTPSLKWTAPLTYV
jgi:hypothetical protein